MEELGPLFTHPGDVSGGIPGWLPIAIALVAMAMCAVAVVRGRLGDSLLALAIVGLPRSMRNKMIRYIEDI